MAGATAWASALSPGSTACSAAATRATMAAVSRALRSPELREQLRQARTVDAIKALFVKDQAPATAA